MMPSPRSSPWHSLILAQCPAMCLVPNRGNVCPVVSLSWGSRVSSKNQGWSVVLGYLFSPGGEIFLLQEISKTLHLTYLGMLHMLYYMKENCKYCFYYDI